MIRIVIAEDQSVICDGIRLLLEQDSDISVAGCASNGREAYELCKGLMPDIVLMDAVMPGCSGIEGVQLIKGRCPAVKVIILTTFKDDDKIFSALKSGADGYLLKDMDTEALLLAIKCVYHGFAILHRDAMDAVASLMEEAGSAIENAGLASSLSSRELDIVRLIVYGKSNKEIAMDLALSEGSVRNIISGVLNKLSLNDRTQLAVLAMKKNLV